MENKKMFSRDKKINLFMIVTLTLLISVTTVGVTFAAFQASTQVNNISGNAKCYSVTYTKGQDISGQLTSSSAYTGGWYTDIIMYANSGCTQMRGTIYLTTNSSNTMTLTDNALKYAVVLNSSVVASGTVTTGTQSLYTNFTLNTSSTTYRVYIWLDSSAEDTTNLNDEAYSGYISAEAVLTSQIKS